MSKNHVLLAEDEESLGLIVKESLETRGFEVTFAKDGEEAMSFYLANKPDMLVLDVMMPKKDGFTLVKEIRNIDPYVPIIFLTAKSRTEDVVEGFGYGVNDYIKKPFSMEELIVRMNALLSRKLDIDKKTATFTVGSYEFDPLKQHLILEDNIQTLTHRESQLLLALIQKKNEVTDRKEVLKALWGNDDFFNARSMDVFITKLRKKLSADPSILLLNERGYGNKLVSD